MMFARKIQVLGQTEFVPRGYDEQRKWLLDRIEEALGPDVRELADEMIPGQDWGYGL